MCNFTLSRTEAAIEAILFAAGEAVEAKRLAAALEVSEKEVISAVETLAEKFNSGERGVHIAKFENSFQLRTNPEYFKFVAALCENRRQKNLTPAILETLAIIAFKQPVTKSVIEEIRGVNADHAVNKLMELDLVCEKGRDHAPGKPILFGTTEEFLRHFGFGSISDLAVF